MIFLVPLKVLGEAIDTVGQQCDLHVRRASVLLMHPEILNYFSFAYILCTHLRIISRAKLGFIPMPVKQFSHLFLLPNRQKLSKTRLFPINLVKLMPLHHT